MYDDTPTPVDDEIDITSTLSPTTTVDDKVYRLARYTHDPADPEAERQTVAVEADTLVVKVGTLVVRANRQASPHSTQVFLDGKPFPVRRLTLSYDVTGQWAVEMDFFPGQVPEN